jgi:ABC-type Na+ efflux pump permease subunit
MVQTIALMTGQEALRSYALQALALLALLSLGFVIFVGEILLFDRATMQRMMVSGLFRLEAVIVVSLAVCTQLAREEQEGQLLQHLALPIARWQYCIGKCLGFVLLAGVISLALGLLCLLLAPPLATLQWSASLFLELIIVVNLSLLMSLSLRRPLVATLAVLAFYTLGRVLSTLNHIADDPVFEETTFHAFMKMLLWGLDTLLPNFDRFTSADWLAYSLNRSTEIGGLFMMSISYSAALLCGAMIDLTRRHL